MSYVLTIRRDTPITADEMRTLVDGDEALSILPVPEAEIGAVLWSGESPALPLSFDEGTLWSTPRNDAAVSKMQEIARTLNARLIGEEGEDLTDEDLATKAPVGCGTKAASLLFALTAGASALTALIQALGWD